MYATLYEVIEEEESKDTDEGAVKKKKKKTVKIVDPKDKMIRVVVLKRGGKKTNSQIIGLETWGVDLQECARLLSKKFACGAASALIDYKEIQGKEGLTV